MINKYIRVLYFICVIPVILSCSSSPDKVQPYWRKVADDFITKGVILYDRQQYRLSSIEFNNALNAYQRFDYVEGIAQSYLNLSKSEIAQDNISLAQVYLGELKRRVEEDQLKTMQVHMDIMSSSLAISGGRVDQAVTIIDAYLDSNGVNRLNTLDSVYMSLLTNRVRAAIQANIDAEKWIHIYEIKMNHAPVYQARLFRFKAHQASHSAKADDMNKNFKFAMTIYRELASPKAVFSTLSEWGDALARVNNKEEAVKKLESAYKIVEGTEHRKKMYKVLRRLLSLYQDLNDDENHRRIQIILSQ